MSKEENISDLISIRKWAIEDYVFNKLLKAGMTEPKATKYLKTKGLNAYWTEYGTEPYHPGVQSGSEEFLWMATLMSSFISEKNISEITCHSRIYVISIESTNNPKWIEEPINSLKDDYGNIREEFLKDEPYYFILNAASHYSVIALLPGVNKEGILDEKKSTLVHINSFGQDKNEPGAKSFIEKHLKFAQEFANEFKCKLINHSYFHQYDNACGLSVSLNIALIEKHFASGGNLENLESALPTFLEKDPQRGDKLKNLYQGLGESVFDTYATENFDFNQVFDLKSYIKDDEKIALLKSIFEVSSTSTDEVTPTTSQEAQGAAAVSSAAEDEVDIFKIYDIYPDEADQIFDLQDNNYTMGWGKIIKKILESKPKDPIAFIQDFAVSCASSLSDDVITSNQGAQGATAVSSTSEDEVDPIIILINKLGEDDSNKFLNIQQNINNDQWEIFLASIAELPSEGIQNLKGLVSGGITPLEVIELTIAGQFE